MSVTRFFVLFVGLVFLTALSVCLYLLGWVLYIHWKYRHIPSPKIMGNFFMGHITELTEFEKKGRHLSMLFLKWKKEYGTVFVIFTMNRAIVVCLEPSIVKELLVNSRSTKPAALYGKFHTVFGQRFVGNGLFSELNNDHWEKKRKMLNPPFKRKYLMDLMYQYNNSTEELISYLKLKADGKTEVHMAHEFNKVALDIIAKVAFGLDNLNVIHDDDAPFCQAVAQSMKGLMHYIRTPFWKVDFRKESQAAMEKSRKAMIFMRNIAEKCILNRIEDIKEGRNYPEDILTHIIKYSRSKDGMMGMEEMIDECFTFFIAGQETTAQLMSYTFEMIGRHPEIYKKLQEEVDCIIGEKPVISYDDISKLEYMTLVFKEVLRYTPPAAGIQRQNVEDIIINGYKIPARSNIALSHYSLSRDERFWDKPEEFNPERFREDNTSFDKEF
ncbi:Cholesterol 24-hydroxylase [Holothuria leucospilota]|uniref:Cholesterol 24-hydroxylase n=1 Tax=Holothuria leucospilota TaxID=206669 RepID=A0A9Q1CIJ7_HOLLE|nr:Cholesterol 24-hydroxylase [Holothuria leucospilota]